MSVENGYEIHGIRVYSPKMRDVVVAMREAKLNGASHMRYEVRDGHTTFIVDIAFGAEP